jgi:DNA ligase-1
MDYEAYLIEMGYEGMILRNPLAAYKSGRATKTMRELLKIKRFEDAEAVIIGVEELMHNENEAKVNALGLTERGHKKANLVPGGVLGALVVRDENGVEFRIGTGFSQAERADLWMKKDSLIGRIVKYKFLSVGMKNAPRHPVFLGWRDLSDM